jgi:hypothetical protein
LFAASLVAFSVASFVAVAATFSVVAFCSTSFWEAAFAMLLLYLWPWLLQ